MKVTDDIVYIGVDDRKIDLFEGQYSVKNGMSYNSYVILDEKIAVMDTVDAAFTEQWLSKLDAALGGRMPDYLIVQHMEPDHSANIMNFMNKYPEAVLVGNAKTFTMTGNFFRELDLSGRTFAVTDGGKLSLGKHELNFIFAPMVHWPEVMFTYDSADKILFSADAFGRFGALDDGSAWETEAGRYYFGIVGKYGTQVQAALKKAAAFDIRTICPLHGPVLTENLSRYIKLYNTWSSYEAEIDGIAVAYTSVYGNTKNAVEKLVRALKEKGCADVAVYDLARCDMYEAVEAAFRRRGLVLATTTYNAGIFPCMREYVTNLKERGFCGRKIGIMENGSWAPMAAKAIKEALQGGKNLVFAETTVSIVSSLSEENLSQLDRLAEEMLVP